MSPSPCSSEVPLLTFTDGLTWQEIVNTGDVPADAGPRRLCSPASAAPAPEVDEKGHVS
ncbi:hypothetical protein AB0I45_01100 [Brevibacterium sp. NPDC049920]|uniref:hypothetical protein n=1 Tax=Brevibacterium sp. NPDC049920 TaxID=3155279 RepID=UPI0033FDDF12